MRRVLCRIAFVAAASVTIIAKTERTDQASNTSFSALSAGLDRLRRRGVRRCGRAEMAADYSRSLRYIRDATSRIDKDYKSEPTPRGCTPLSLAQGARGSPAIPGGGAPDWGADHGEGCGVARGVR